MHLKLHAHTVLKEILAESQFFLRLHIKVSMIREKVRRWILRKVACKKPRNEHESGLTVSTVLSL